MDPEALPLLSLTTALGAGLLIGLVYERRKSDDPAVAAGLRTHTLASLLGAIATWLGAPVFLVVLLMVGAFAALSYLRTDRKSTRLNSSHVKISYAVFCLKKKKTRQ